MADLKYCNYCDNCEGHRTVETYYWETEEPLNAASAIWPKEIENGQRYGVYAGGNGDFCSHMVEIISIEGDV